MAHGMDVNGNVMPAAGPRARLTDNGMLRYLGGPHRAGRPPPGSALGASIRIGVRKTVT